MTAEEKLHADELLRVMKNTIGAKGLVRHRIQHRHELWQKRLGRPSVTRINTSYSAVPAMPLIPRAAYVESFHRRCGISDFR
jgi:hypothetical protein